MRQTGAIDLHMHSLVSDGTDTPAGLIGKAAEAGLDLFSLTDHDAMAGCREILAAYREGTASNTGAAAENGLPRFVTGAEFAARDEEGKYHILAYGCDPDHPAMAALCDRVHRMRLRKVEGRLDFLEREYGFTFRTEDREALLKLTNPGKPHIGNMMADYGYAADKDEAIRRYIIQWSGEGRSLAPEEIIPVITEAGGIPVLAHPAFGSGSQRILGEDMDRRIRHLLPLGIRGLEAYYSGFSGEIMEEQLALAEKYGLFVTAGSDFHGGNKTVAIGDTGPGSPGEKKEKTAPFLEALSDRIVSGDIIVSFPENSV